MSKLPYCLGCPLYGAPGPVWGEGSREQARFIYIAEKPGPQECHGSRPMIGPTGNVFNAQLAQVGIRRSEIYITNQVKCMPPENQPPPEGAIKHCAPLLKAELKACKSNTIVLSGAVAWKANIGSYSTIHKHYQASDNIMSRRGCVEIKDEKKWIGTIHPAFIMRMPEFRHLALDDLRKAWRIADTSLLNFDLTINLNPTTSEIRDYVQYITGVTQAFADDVETQQQDLAEDEEDYVGADYKVDMCGIGGEPRHAMVVDTKDIPLLKPAFCTSTEIWRYEHNGPYDNYHLEKFFPPEEMKCTLFDTMLGAHYLRSHARKALKPGVLSTYTDLPYYDRKLEYVSRKLYNAMDIVTTFQAAETMRRKMKQMSLEDVFFTYGMPVLPILEEWRREGVNINIRKALLFKRYLQDRIDKSTLMISKLCGPFLNVASPKQVSEFLYTKHGLPPQYKDKNQDGKRIKSLTVDFEARKILRAHIEKIGEHQAGGKWRVPYLFLTLMDYVAGETAKIEFLNRISPDGRIHAFYKAHGERPFRLSSSPNLQNWPVYDISDWGGAKAKNQGVDPTGAVKTSMGSLRSLIIPDRPEDWILTCDFEQVQLWLYAKQYNVKWLLDLFESREYIYGIVYEKLYNGDKFFRDGCPRTKKFMLPEVPQQRIRRAKAVPLGFLFGRTGEAVAAEYGWPADEGRALRKWWYDLNPELLKSYEIIEKEVKETGRLRQLFGHIMWFPAGNMNEAINSKAQSAEAIVMIGSIIQIDQKLKSSGLQQRGNRLMLSVHDSLSLNVTTNDAEEVYESIVKPVLERPIKELDNFILRHSAEMSKEWDWGTLDYNEWKHQQSRTASGNCLELASGEAIPKGESAL